MRQEFGGWNCTSEGFCLSVFRVLCILEVNKQTLKSECLSLILPLLFTCCVILGKLLNLYALISSSLNVPACKIISGDAGGIRDEGSIPGSGRFHGGGHWQEGSLPLAPPGKHKIVIHRTIYLTCSGEDEQFSQVKHSEGCPEYSNSNITGACLCCSGQEWCRQEV